MDPVVHFEMPFDDPKRLSKFYKSAFGWSMQGMGEQMGNYVLAQTTETSPRGRPRKPGAINGGFFPKESGGPQEPSVVIEVGDIRKAMQKVAKAGGKVLGEPMEIPGIGQYVSFMDTEGNRVSILQPPAKAKPAPKKKAAAAKRKK